MTGADDSSAKVLRIEHLLNLMSARMPWTMGAKVVEAIGIRKSRGWAETIASFRDVPPSGEALSRCLAKLEATVLDHLLVGEKQVLWYEWRHLSDEIRVDLESWIKSVRPRSLQSDREPFDIASMPYKASELKPLVRKPPVLVSASRVNEELRLLYFSVRTYTTREEIDVSAFPPKTRERFDDYLEVIGLRARNIPCVDAVVFDPHTSRTEIRMDHQRGMKSDGEDAAFTAIIEHLNAVLFRAKARMPMGLGLVDFAPAVNRLYLDSRAGRVEFLGFVANSATASSNNTGKVHRRANQDLRRDPFHLGGKGAVSSIDPYTIGVSFETPSKTERGQLELHGSVRKLFGPHRGGITSAGMYGCLTLEDHEFLSGVLAAHLPKPK